MPDVITDRQVVAVLRPFVRATTPLLTALRKRVHPRGGDEVARDDWWVNGMGRFTVLLASAPGVGGALADRLPIQDTLALAGQGLLLCAIAAEHGVTSQAERVRLLAAVLFQRNVDPALAAGVVDQAAEDRATAELTEDLPKPAAKISVRAVTRTLWRLGKTMWALGDELDKRPKGRVYHRVLGWLPVVGIVGDYLGERSALKRAAKAAGKWLSANVPASN